MIPPLTVVGTLVATPGTPGTAGTVGTPSGAKLKKKS